MPRRTTATKAPSLPSPAGAGEGTGRGTPLAAAAVVGLGSLTASLDTAVNVAFPFITRHFALPVGGIQWVAICYVLTYASLMLVCGRLGDLYGYRAVFCGGLAWSIVAFLLCAVAPSYDGLLAMRVLQGIGAALVVSCGPAFATSFLSEAERGRALATYTLLFSLGSFVGPASAGFLIQAWGWPVVYWARAPIALLALVLAWRLPRLPPRAAAPARAVDVPGAVLVAATLAALLLAVNRAQDAGSGALALGLGLAGAACLAAFVRHERRTATPLLDLGFFRNPDFALVTVAGVIINIAGFTVLLLVPYWLTRVPGLGTGAAGLVLATGPLGVLLASPVGGRLLGRVPAYALALAGTLLAAGGLFAVSRWEAGTGLAGLAGALWVQGFGLGLFQLACLDIVTGIMPRADRGVAGSVATLTRSIGVVAGATTMSAIFSAHQPAGTGAADLGLSPHFVLPFQATFAVAAAMAGSTALICAWRLAARRRA